MKNFSKDMSPEDKTSLFVEFFVDEGDEIWKMQKEKLFKLSMEHFETLGLFTRAEVRNYLLFKKRFVYPGYDLHYLQHLAVIKN